MFLLPAYYPVSPTSKGREELQQPERKARQESILKSPCTMPRLKMRRMRYQIGYSDSGRRMWRVEQVKNNDTPVGCTGDDGKA